MGLTKLSEKNASALEKRQPQGSAQKLYFVSEAAEKLGITAKTLKNWEKKGQIPAVLRDHNGNRVYTDEEIDVIREVKGLGRRFPPNPGQPES